MSIVLKQRIQALTSRVEVLEDKANKPSTVVEDADSTLEDTLDALTVRVEALENPVKRKRRTPEQMAQARSEGAEV